MKNPVGFLLTLGVGNVLKGWKKTLLVSGLAAGVWLAGWGAAVCSPAFAATSYVVRSGDCLWTIAQHHGVTVNALMQANGLTSDQLQVGRVLKLPTSGAALPAVSRAPVSGKIIDYVVTSGDSLWSIATRHGTTVAAIKAANGLTSDSLQIGQRLRLSFRTSAVTGSTRPVLSPALPSRGGDDSVRDILSYASSLLGTPYRSGGAAPGGFDCSGFVSHVMGEFGVSLPRTSWEQFKRGTAVERDALEPGDLVFFTTYASGASHVGIYTGNGKFIHSSSPHSGGVIVTSMSDTYYSTRYLGARRVV